MTPLLWVVGAGDVVKIVYAPVDFDSLSLVIVNIGVVVGRTALVTEGPEVVGGF